MIGIVVTKYRFCVGFPGSLPDAYGGDFETLDDVIEYIIDNQLYEDDDPERIETELRADRLTLNARGQLIAIHEDQVYEGDEGES